MILSLAGSAGLARLRRNWVGAVALAVELRSNPAAPRVGRADRIRTCDLLNPIQAHYQAVLRPDKLKGS